MYHPTRGGARGGAAEFSWDKVKDSKDREFYLGNSVAAPTGRWQDGRDINWYNKDASSSTAADERREELRRIKEAETAALYAKLGRAPPTEGGGAEVRVGERLASGSGGVGRRAGTGANTEAMKDAKQWGKPEEELSEADKKLARKFARDEVRRRRAAAGEADPQDGEEKKSRTEDDYDRHRRHRHHHSSRHRDDDRDDKRHRGHRHRRGSRSRSRSPESSSRHRRRDDGDEIRRTSKISSSRTERGREAEDSRHADTSERHRHRDDRSSRHRSRRD